jgi:hypothetical protein
LSRNRPSSRPSVHLRFETELHLYLMYVIEYIRRGTNHATGS